MFRSILLARQCLFFVLRSYFAPRPCLNAINVTSFANSLRSLLPVTYHSPGLRLSALLAFSYCLVACHSLLTGSGNEEAAKRTLVVQGVALAVSIVGAKAAPKKKKD